MSTPYIGEIQVFAFNYYPEGWVPCNGATLSVSQYPELFALIGTTYGGNGSTTFQLPNFTGRAACGQGQGQSLTNRNVGDTFGEQEINLTSNQIPSHNHVVNLFHQPNAALIERVPNKGDALTEPAETLVFVPNASPNTTFAEPVIGITGSGSAHENRQPLLALNFCIALEGEYPTFD